MATCAALVSMYPIALELVPTRPSVAKRTTAISGDGELILQINKTPIRVLERGCDRYGHVVSQVAVCVIARIPKRPIPTKVWRLVPDQTDTVSGKLEVMTMA